MSDPIPLVAQGADEQRMLACAYLYPLNDAGLIAPAAVPEAVRRAFMDRLLTKGMLGREVDGEIIKTPAGTGRMRYELAFHCIDRLRRGDDPRPVEMDGSGMALMARARDERDILLRPTDDDAGTVAEWEALGLIRAESGGAWRIETSGLGFLMAAEIHARLDGVVRVAPEAAGEPSLADPTIRLVDECAAWDADFDAMLPGVRRADDARRWAHEYLNLCLVRDAEEAGSLAWLLTPSAAADPPDAVVAPDVHARVLARLEGRGLIHGGQLTQEGMEEALADLVEIAAEWTRESRDDFRRLLTNAGSRRVIGEALAGDLILRPEGLTAAERKQVVRTHQGDGRRSDYVGPRRLWRGWGLVRDAGDGDPEHDVITPRGFVPFAAGCPGSGPEGWAGPEDFATTAQAALAHRESLSRPMPEVECAEAELAALQAHWAAPLLLPLARTPEEQWLVSYAAEGPWHLKLTTYEPVALRVKAQPGGRSALRRVDYLATLCPEAVRATFLRRLEDVGLLPVFGRGRSTDRFFPDVARPEMEECAAALRAAGGGCTLKEIATTAAERRILADLDLYLDMYAYTPKQQEAAARVLARLSERGLVIQPAPEECPQLWVAVPGAMTLLAPLRKKAGAIR